MTADTHKNRKIRPDLLICLFLLAITLTAYREAGKCDFVSLDDKRYIIENSNINSGFTWEGVKWAFRFPNQNYWHPLTWLSHMLDCHLYGLNAGMHHQSNLILHMLNVLLVFWVFRHMSGARWQSAFVAALFAVHPINVESVAWVAERKNVLSTFFWLLTMLGYSFYLRQPSFRRYLLTFLLFTAGLLSKPMLVTLPFVLLLLDYWPFRRFELYPLEKEKIFRLIAEKTPFFALSAVSVWISSLSLELLDRNNSIIVSTETVPLSLRAANALLSCLIYLRKMILPYDLAVFYPYPESVPLWQIAGAGSLIAGISFLAVRKHKTAPYFIVGWLWYLGTLFPVSGLKQAGLWPALADRWAYVPMIGIFAIVSWGVSGVCSDYPRIRPAIMASVLFILSFSAWSTHAQVRHWMNSLSLFQHAVDVTSANYVAHDNLGGILLEEGRNAEAFTHFSAAAQIKPDFWKSYSNAGVALANMGKKNEAVRYFRKSLELNPDNAGAHNNIGVSLAEQGRFEEAVFHFQEALKTDPNFSNARKNLQQVMRDIKNRQENRNQRQ